MLTPSDWSKLTQAAAHLAASTSGSTTRLPCRSSSFGRRFAACRRSSTGSTRPPGTRAAIGLVVVDYLQLMRGREGAQLARAGDQRDLTRAQAARQGAVAAGHRAQPAQSRRRDARREEQAPAAVRPTRVGRHRARRGQHLLYLSGRLLQQGHRRPRTRGAHHRQAAQRPDRHRRAFASMRSTRASTTSPKGSTRTRCS